MSYTGGTLQDMHLPFQNEWTALMTAQTPAQIPLKGFEQGLVILHMPVQYTMPIQVLSMSPLILH